MDDSGKFKFKRPVFKAPELTAPSVPSVEPRLQEPPAPKEEAPVIAPEAAPLQESPLKGVLKQVIQGHGALLPRSLREAMEGLLAREAPWSRDEDERAYALLERTRGLIEGRGHLNLAATTAIQQIRTEAGDEGRRRQTWVVEESRKISILAQRLDALGRTLIEADEDHLRRFRLFVDQRIEEWGTQLPDQLQDRIRSNLTALSPDHRWEDLRELLPPLEAVRPPQKAQLDFPPIPTQIASVSGSFLGLLRQYSMAVGMLGMTLAGVLTIFISQESMGGLNLRYLLLPLTIPLFLPLAIWMARKKRAQQLAAQIESAKGTLKQSLSQALTQTFQSMNSRIGNELTFYGQRLTTGQAQTEGRWKSLREAVERGIRGGG